MTFDQRETFRRLRLKGFWVRLGFPVAMLVGASLWDNKPWMLASTRAGDRLVKMLLRAFILSKWRGTWAIHNKQPPALRPCPNWRVSNVIVVAEHENATNS